MLNPKTYVIGRFKNLGNTVQENEMEGLYIKCKVLGCLFMLLSSIGCKVRDYRNS